MRITTQMKFQKSVADYQYGMSQIQKYNNQISSGTKISNSFEDASVYNDGMRLDYEIVSLEQVVDATQKSVNFSQNSDQSLQEFSKQLERFKVKLAQAASDVHDVTSRMAIAQDLEGIRDYLINIANTSINGQFLFSGSTVNIKPINGNGDYMGNDETMKAKAGSQIDLPFNISGKELFKGTDTDYRRHLTTNVSLIDQTKKDSDDAPKFLTESSRIVDMIGKNYIIPKDREKINYDYDFLPNEQNKYPDTFFYLQGRKPDGTSFTSKFQLTSDTTIQGLMDKIGREFGNDERDKVVDVTLNADGQINVTDLTRGNNFIDFHLVAATEQVNDKESAAQTVKDDVAFYQNKAANSKRSIADSNSLQALEENVKKYQNDPANRIYVMDFTQNAYKDMTGNETNAYDFDKVRFNAQDSKLTSNISQVIRSNNKYATEDTPLAMTAGTNTLYKDVRGNDIAGLYNIDGESIKINVKSRSGEVYDLTVRFTADGAKLDYTTNVKNGAGQYVPLPTRSETGITIMQSNEFMTRAHNNNATAHSTPNREFTYRQLNDIIAMAASGRIEQLQKDNYDSYAANIIAAKDSVDVRLNEFGKIELIDKSLSVTPIELSVYSGKETTEAVIVRYENGIAITENVNTRFKGDSTTGQGRGSTFSFMENNAIEIDEPSIDIFKDLNKMIEAVKGGYYRASNEHKDPRNTGIQGALERIDHIMDHIHKQETVLGSYTNSLKDTQHRAEIMIVNVSSVKSDLVDTDYGKAYLALNQHMMAYQAILQASAKINQLSLLNYM
ncbi:flagellin [Campylobacter sp. 19-13652]|uniref:flagellin N-terminal helical domain-containing protein n=1 Tax=Campylobacter sp. 19-13652 TaxID=2840180 RepID=UPI001C7969D0|nr:flagellin [Campylobacter sp. 19-13652]BCX79512.1 flagellin [Campylobacter sp. 19-13652]